MIEAGICPKCGEGNLDYGPSESESEMIKYPFTCSGCGFVGIEWYNVEFNTITDADGDEIKDVEENDN